MDALLTAWFSRPVPNDAAHKDLAYAIKFRTKNAAVRRHIVAMLGNKEKTGSARICDVYAAEMAGLAELPFKADDSLEARDKAIVPIRAWVAKS